MFNIVDFFEPYESKLALPAARVVILLGGVPCERLHLKEILRSGWPNFSRAKFVFESVAAGDSVAAGMSLVREKVEMGRSVSIRRFYSSGVQGSGASSIPVFAGKIESIRQETGDGREMLEVIARDCSADFERVLVYGRRAAGADEKDVFLSGAETIFNPDGKGNAAVLSSSGAGEDHTLFSSDSDCGSYWRYSQAIDYLLCEYMPAGKLHRPSIAQLDAITECQTLRDFDVTGLSLLEALHRCCDRIGLAFRFVPRLIPGCSGQAIVFYRPGSGPVMELNCQEYGERLSISQTNISSLKSEKHFWPVTNRYIGQGDYKIYEATFELVKGWDPNLEDTDYDKFSPSMNPDFYKVKDIYRKWCLNEAGDYTGAPYSRGEAFDFSKVFEKEQYVCRRRRFWPALSRDLQGKSLGYYLQVSFNGGLTWWQYLYAFNNLLEECGIWLSSDQLDVDTWIAALKGELKFRITASIVSDARINYQMSDGPVGSVIPVQDHLFVTPGGFKCRKVCEESIFYNSTDGALGTADEVDDSAPLREFVRGIAKRQAATAQKASITTAYLNFDYDVGDRVVIGPDGRNILDSQSDNRSMLWVNEVRLDFDKQKTVLGVVRQRNLQV